MSFKSNGWVLIEKIINWHLEGFFWPVKIHFHKVLTPLCLICFMFSNQCIIASKEPIHNPYHQSNDKESIPFPAIFIPHSCVCCCWRKLLYNFQPWTSIFFKSSPPPHSKHHFEAMGVALYSLLERSLYVFTLKPNVSFSKDFQTRGFLKIATVTWTLKSYALNKRVFENHISTKTFYFQDCFRFF